MYFICIKSIVEMFYNCVYCYFVHITFRYYTFLFCMLKEFKLDRYLLYISANTKLFIHKKYDLVALVHGFYYLYI